MDQTRFKTLQKGIEVARDLELPEAERRTKGTCFTLSLLVAMPSSFGDVELPLDIIVDRPRVGQVEGVYKFANGDLVVDTTARLEPTGAAFNISIMFQLEKMRTNGACVVVSKDMEKIILDQLAKDLDQLLENGPEREA